MLFHRKASLTPANLRQTSYMLRQASFGGHERESHARARLLWALFVAGISPEINALRFFLLVLDMTQVLSNKEKVFLRIANDRGWTYARNPHDNSVLFEEIHGEVAEDV